MAFTTEQTWPELQQHQDCRRRVKQLQRDRDRSIRSLVVDHILGRGGELLVALDNLGMAER